MLHVALKAVFDKKDPSGEDLQYLVECLESERLFKGEPYRFKWDNYDSRDDLEISRTKSLWMGFTGYQIFKILNPEALFRIRVGYEILVSNGLLFKVYKKSNYPLEEGMRRIKPKPYKSFKDLGTILVTTANDFNMKLLMDQEFAYSLSRVHHFIFGLQKSIKNFGSHNYAIMNPEGDMYFSRDGNSPYFLDAGKHNNKESKVENFVNEILSAPIKPNVVVVNKDYRKNLCDCLSERKQPYIPL